MRQLTILISAAVLAALAATALPAVAPAAPAAPVQDAEGETDVCLRNNRIWSWDLVDSSTLRIGVRGDERDYLVHMIGPCIGLEQVMFRLRFQTATNLGCIGQGDRISYDFPGIGRQVCFVRGVSLAAPEETLEAEDAEH